MLGARYQHLEYIMFSLTVKPSVSSTKVRVAAVGVVGRYGLGGRRQLVERILVTVLKVLVI